MNINDIDEYIGALLKAPMFRSGIAAHDLRPGRAGRGQPLEKVLPAGLADMLRRLNITHLHQHQCEALSAMGQGLHTVVATDTASGKSLVYNAAMLQAIGWEPQARGLYIFPLKALAQDQLTGFERWARECPLPHPTAAIYDGDTPAYRRGKIRLCPPNVLMTNPEMVHLSLLPFHDRWHGFWSQLRLIVIDEVHTYRGMLGNHMSQVLRRVLRICRHHGSRPLFVFTSATVNNPSRLANDLIGMPVHAVTENGAPCGARHTVLVDPGDSPAQTAIALLKAALARQLRTIVYTQSRKLAELISVWARERSGRWADRISVYRAGLMPQERREIEGRLKSGELLAVVSTSALELGIDIGDLDLCILVGYPGSIISTLQRGGRVGRQGQASAMIMVATENALDKYFLAHPEAFFQAKAEAAVVNPFNAIALQHHLICAAAELPLAPDETWLQQAEVKETMSQLEYGGDLRRTADGKRLHSRSKRPHRGVHLRGSGDRYPIVDASIDSVLGEIDGHRLYRDTHPGAIYLHQGVTYRIESVDSHSHCVRAVPVQVEYYTRARSHLDVEIQHTSAFQRIGRIHVCLGNIKITEQVTGYDMVRTAGGQTLKRFDLEAPPVRFETQGIWLDIPSDVCGEVIHRSYDLLGALHAAEHAAISMMPLLVLVDRNDVGGLSTPFHPQTGSAAIFVYDGVPGGAGFSAQAYAQAVEWIDITRQAVERCPCDRGCPACVHSPKCGSGNQPIDKAGAAALLSILRQPGAPRVSPHLLKLVEPTAPRQTPSRRLSAHPETFGVFDLETQRSAGEVGGWHMAHLMRISCGVVYDSRTGRYEVYLEDRLEELIAHLRRLELVVGFNSKRFDYKVLSGYSGFDFQQLPGFDILEAVRNRLGFGLSLDHLAEATLGTHKSASGLDALKWWQEGCLGKIIDYCRMDVRITRDLYRFARKKGYLLYRDREGVKFRIPLEEGP